MTNGECQCRTMRWRGGNVDATNVDATPPSQFAAPSPRREAPSPHRDRRTIWFPALPPAARRRSTLRRGRRSHGRKHRSSSSVIRHPSFVIRHWLNVECWMFDVGCWMFHQCSSAPRPKPTSRSSAISRRRMGGGGGIVAATPSSQGAAAPRRRGKAGNQTVRLCLCGEGGASCDGGVASTFYTRRIQTSFSVSFRVIRGQPFPDHP